MSGPVPPGIPPKTTEGARLIQEVTEAFRINDQEKFLIAVFEIWERMSKINNGNIPETELNEFIDKLVGGPIESTTFNTTKITKILEEIVCMDQEFRTIVGVGNLNLIRNEVLNFLLKKLKVNAGIKTQSEGMQQFGVFGSARIDEIFNKLPNQNPSPNMPDTRQNVRNLKSKIVKNIDDLAKL